MTEDLPKEALRQQMLLRALWRDARPGVVAGWLRDAPERSTRGLQAYQANAGALAERALAAAFPTIAQLVGEASFAALARAFWAAHAPAHGDMAQWGAELPGFIAMADQLASEPYLADVARLEWAVHEAETAADTPATPQGLELLAGAEPQALRLVLKPGTALLSSTHPVATIWLAHRSEGDDRFTPVRAAFAAGIGERAFVWRAGFKSKVAMLAQADAQFVGALLAHQTLADALQAAGDEFNFETWLIAALRQGWLMTITTAITTTALKDLA